MKIFVKTLTGAQFDINVEPSNTVAEVKKTIEGAKGAASFPAERMKLIHAGSVLKDDATVESSKVKENAFVVCMVTKAKKKPAATAATAAAAATDSSAAPSATAAAAPSATAADVSATASTTATTAADADTTMTDATSTDANATAADSTNTGSSQFCNPETVTQLASMGFPEDQVRAALTAAFGNAERAVEYLMNGIPAAAQQQQQQQQAVSSGTAAPTATGNASDPLAPLRNNPQFNQLRQQVQANPAVLPQVLQSIGQSNPQLLQLINNNRQAFIQLMNEPVTTATSAQPTTGTQQQQQQQQQQGGMPGMGGMPNPQQLHQLMTSIPPAAQAQLAQRFGMTPEQFQGVIQQMQNMDPQQFAMMAQMMGGMGAMGGMGGMPGGQGGQQLPPGAVQISLTQEEAAAVGRLEEMGFSRQACLQAYLACDKNEELAANFLMDS